MIKDQNLKLTLTKSEALVLFDFIARFNKAKPTDFFADEVEQKIFWNLECQLEKELVEIFRPDYKDIIDEARTKVSEN